MDLVRDRHGGLRREQALTNRLWRLAVIASEPQASHALIDTSEIIAARKSMSVLRIDSFYEL